MDQFSRRINSAILFFLLSSLFFWGCEKEKSDDTKITDIDGNIYNVVELGSQNWMAENLKVTRYNNGDSIPNVISGNTWIGLETGAYAKFMNKDDLAEVYGYLYNWHAVNSQQNMCPSGWHVPSFQDWKELITYLDGEYQAGGKMKESGTEHWENNVDASNESGLTMLPGGYRSHSNAASNSMGIYGTWWTSTEIDSLLAWGIALRYYDSNVYKSHFYKKMGCCIRCMKDQ